MTARTGTQLVADLEEEIGRIDSVAVARAMRLARELEGLAASYIAETGLPPSKLKIVRQARADGSEHIWIEPR